jgi:coenzyme PQQ synthesis protein D (PqqD)
MPRKLVSRIVGGQAVVIPVLGGADGRSAVYSFNESGTMLWTMLESGRSLEDLVSGLESEYGLSPDQALDDATQFVENLKQEGLMEPA